MGTLVITVKPKAKTMQTKMSTQQMSIQPDSINLMKGIKAK